uniref:Uncharacterized protein n=1 Tax=Anopheles coluzzii TaxID=1518534 RepID=A0A8W7PK53_ANOCL
MVLHPTRRTLLHFTRHRLSSATTTSCHLKIWKGGPPLAGGIASISDPEHPAVRRTSSAKSTVDAVGIVFSLMRKISSLAAASGSRTYTIRSRRPGRIRARSIRSGRFVAATIRTSFSTLTPSISVSSWASTRSFTELPDSADRSPPIASISSKNMIDGATCRARRNRSRTARSDSPTHMENSSEPLMERKLRRLSVAIAFAIIVFEQPGGPNISRPRGGLMPSRSNSSGWWMGQSMIWRSFSFSSSWPPMSVQRTLGHSIMISRIALGFTCCRAAISAGPSIGLPVGAEDAAFETKFSRSAPTYPCVMRATARMSSSGTVWPWRESTRSRMAARAIASGTGSSNS